MSKTLTANACRNLVLVLGDQLDAKSSAFDGFDKEQDIVWMAEVAEESTHVWNHKARIVIFLAAMRHFREELLKRGVQVSYKPLDASKSTFQSELKSSIQELRPEKIILVEPGEWRVRESISKTAQQLHMNLEIRDDRHFYCSREEFREHASSRKQLRMEYFYREMRRKHRVLMEGDEPAGGSWNYDKENRGAFGIEGPQRDSNIKKFQPDKITSEVINLVEERFASHPGKLKSFNWPVTRKQALAALKDFVKNRLAEFGKYQDAMWREEPYLYHSRLSAAMNLKLLNPREVVDAAVEAYESGLAPLNSVEGFVRQILGWREFVRGVYWHFMPEYLEKNSLDANEPLPDFYWTGETEMECLKQAIHQTLEHGYAHHIQRLMVTGLFSLMLGVDPKQVHEWYLAVYVDAVEWVELPNSLGMSQFADGGIMASKPYVATGKYIDRMSNYCKHCRYNPSKSIGEDACPFTTLYWDFLAKHQETLKQNNRMSLQLRNLLRKQKSEIDAIQSQAKNFRESIKSCSMSN